MRAKIRDTELYFDVDGAGLIADGPRMRQKPVVFVVHGGPGADHTTCKPAFSPLSQTLQLVYFDHRGQGRSARGPQATYTLDNNVEDMEALRQYLGLSQIVVLGFSYGGMVALSYAVRYPQHVSRLIVAVTAPDGCFLQLAQQTLAERGTPEQQAIAQLLWTGSFETEAQLRQYFQIMGPLYSLTYDPKVAAEAWSRVILSPAAINQAFGGFLRSYSVVEQLPQITAPTLVIGARHDWICPPEYSEAIAAAIPHAKLQIVENSGHSIRADAPEVLRELISAFLAEEASGLGSTGSQ